MFKEDNRNIAGFWAISSIWIGFAGCFCEIVACVASLWWLPSGTIVRPFDLFNFEFLIVIATAWIGLKRAFRGLRFARGQTFVYALSAIGTIISVAPFYVGRYALIWIVAKHHLRLAG